jgi:hypothetical protein
VIRANALAFIDQHGAEAHRLGWTGAHWWSPPGTPNRNERRNRPDSDAGPGGASTDYRELSVRQQRLPPIHPQRQRCQLIRRPYRPPPSNPRRIRSKVLLLWSSPCSPRDARCRRPMNSSWIRQRRCHPSHYHPAHPAPKLSQAQIRRA